MITGNKALESAKTLIAFCGEQDGCQNCIFRKFGADSWNCHLRDFPFYLKYDLNEVEENIQAKKRNHGYL